MQYIYIYIIIISNLKAKIVSFSKKLFFFSHDQVCFSFNGQFKYMNFMHDCSHHIKVTVDLQRSNFMIFFSSLII